MLLLRAGCLFSLCCSLAVADDLTLTEAKTAHAKADKVMNEGYEEAKATLSESLFQELRADQRGWIEYRDHRSEMAAAVEGQAEEGKEKLRVEYWKTLADITEDRTRILSGWTKWDSFPREWEGVWIDGQGGWLRILESEDGALQFGLSVVRGPTYHIGEIGGMAESNEVTARFATEALIDDGETWLTFVKRGVKLEIIAERSAGHHGARAYFDGDYVRIAELGEEDKKEILDAIRGEGL